jgi:subtilisin-like proprotein convertase family protein
MEHKLSEHVLERDRGQSPWGQWPLKVLDLIRRPHSITGPYNLIGVKSRIDALAD